MGKRLLTALAVSAGISFSMTSAPSKAGCAPDPLLGSVCLVGFNFCPRQYTEAAGQLLPISNNQALFSLIGCTYGGDCRTDFALPDLRGRVPISYGTGPGLSTYQIGQEGGVETVPLTVNQMPAHNHTATLRANSAGGNTEIPTGNVLANSRRSAIYESAAPDTDLGTGSIAVSNAGAGQAHENRQPFLALRYCIATQGIFPSRN